MKYSEARQGRVFVIRLEDGDIVHKALEGFAKEKGIKAAAMIILGGADEKSCLVTGPEHGRTPQIKPQTHILDNVHEVAGVGTLFPNETGEVVLHMHMACGRSENTITGCIRQGVRVWHVMEVILYEIVGTTGVRKKDLPTGFDLLIP